MAKQSIANYFTDRLFLTKLKYKSRTYYFRDNYIDGITKRLMFAFCDAETREMRVFAGDDFFIEDGVLIKK
jgi:hypothetical protein